jgi:hypothetical protein
MRRFDDKLVAILALAAVVFAIYAVAFGVSVALKRQLVQDGASADPASSEADSRRKADDLPVAFRESVARAAVSASFEATLRTPTHTPNAGHDVNTPVATGQELDTQQELLPPFTAEHPVVSAITGTVESSPLPVGDEEVDATVASVLP